MKTNTRSRKLELINNSGRNEKCYQCSTSDKKHQVKMHLNIDSIQNFHRDNVVYGTLKKMENFGTHSTRLT